MTSPRHARKLTIAPQSPMRWVLTLLGGWSIATSGLNNGQEYDHVVSFVLAAVLLAAGIVPAHLRSVARSAVRWLASVLLGLAGVLAAISLDEALTLVAAAITAELLSLLFNSSRSRARHAAS